LRSVSQTSLSSGLSPRMSRSLTRR
jgi:hypothetical protein